MATNTTYYNMVKPGYDDVTDISDINGNMDIIDTTLHSHEGNISSNSSAISALQDTQAVIRLHPTGGSQFQISGTFASIGSFIVDNMVANKWIYARVDPTDTSGYYAGSGFSIMANLSSAQYGWCYLMSDRHASSPIVFGQLASGTWKWSVPTMTTVT